MSDIKRVFLIVLDSCGIGDAPDAKDFGDEGANTIKSISESKEFNIEKLCSLGFSNIQGLSFLGEVELKSKVARLQALGKKCLAKATIPMKCSWLGNMVII